MTGDAPKGIFSGKVFALVVFYIFNAAMGIVNGVLTAALLGPAGKGEYYLLVLLPTTVVVLTQLGLPSAFSYYSAKGQTRGLVTRALTLGGIFSAVAVAGTVLLLPILQRTLLRGPDPPLIILGMLAVPFALTTTFLTAVVIGRQAVRWSISANAVTSMASLFMLVALVGIAGLGVMGAVIAVLGTRAVQFLGFYLGANAVTRKISSTRVVPVQDLFRYGLPLYPGSVTLFFGYRFDVYLLAWLLADPTTHLGYYSMAVAMAEMSLMVPNAVMTLFFPYVAGSAPDASNRHLGLTSRVTLLLTGVAAAALVPASMVLFFAVLPEFSPALPALFVLLLSVVGLGASKVMSAYLLGVGMTSIISAINVGAFGLNVALNLILIPRYGILGAAIASLVTYLATAVASSVTATRVAGVPITDVWVPRRADVVFILESVRAQLARRAPPRRSQLP